MSTLQSIEINSSATRRATRTAFLSAGFAMGAWAPLVPYAQQRLQIGSGELGNLLFCLGLGSIITMFFTGRLTSRFGARKMITLGLLIVCATLPLLATVTNVYLMMASLLLFGAGLGLTEVTVNIQGALVEHQSSRPLMSGFHAFYSIGGILGAGLGSLLLTVGFTPLWMQLGAIVCMLVLLAFSRPYLLPYASTSDDSADRPFRLNGTLVLMALICMCSFLAEGAMLDWGGVWLNQQRGLAIEYASLGYACFGVAMSLVRLIGDNVVRKIGRYNSLLLSGLLGATGYAIAVIFSGWQWSILGFILVGIGAANIVPVITTLTSQQSIMPANKSVAFVSTLGYLGILIGPALLGWVAQFSGLAVAFVLVAILMGMVVIGGLLLKTSANHS